MSLTDRLWSGVKSLAPQPPKITPIIEEPVTRLVYSIDPVDAEAMFVGMLNANQRNAWEGGYEPYAANSDWVIKHVPVIGNPTGRQWYISFMRRRYDGGEFSVRLSDADKHGRCFRARRVPTKANDYDGESGINNSMPFVAAIAFLCQLQADDNWILDRAG